MADRAAPQVGCLRCGRRQSDPGRGPSPWKRGVAGGRLVLICPDCQRSPAWPDVLDRCAACGSTALVRRLGETACRSCGHEGSGLPGPEQPPTTAGDPAAALSADVDVALTRVFPADPRPRDG